MKPITPCLWFDDQGEEAAAFYTGLFPDSRITDVSRYGPNQPGPEGKAMTVEFELNGRPFLALGSVVALFFGHAILHGYWTLFHH